MDSPINGTNENIGYQNWTNPQGISGIGGSATCSAIQTNLLVGTNFGFNLSSASIIQGIELDLNVGCDYFCCDSEVYLR